MAAPKSSNLSLLALFILLMGGTHHAVGMDLKKTEIEFYMHDVVTASKNFTTMKVAHSPEFGMIRVIDNALTEGLQQNSKELGRARGEHSGSTLCLQGQDGRKQREISVVGGTGHFRHATGHAIIEKQLSMGENAILNFNVTVLHRSELAE